MKLGEKLKRRRNSLGLTLTEAAKLAGFKSYQKLYKIERGVQTLKAYELAALAQAYSIDINMFLLESSRESEAQVFWRAAEKPGNANVLEAKSKLYLERYLHLLDLLDFDNGGSKLSTISHAITSIEAATEQGEHYRYSMKLGERPSLTFRRILEEGYNLPLFFFDMPQGVSAIAVLSLAQAAICVNSQDAPWRQNFDIAHELFHVLYRQLKPEKCGASDSKTLESFANAFAAAFLLPHESLELEIKRRRKRSPIGLTELLILACDYDVSIDTLLWRLVNLGYTSRKKVRGILQDDVVKDMYKKVRKSKSPVMPHISHKYMCLVFEAINIGRMSKLRAAEYLETPVDELNQLFDNFGLYTKDESDIEITI